MILVPGLLITGLVIRCCFLLQLWADGGCELFGFGLVGLLGWCLLGFFLVVCLIVIAVRLGVLGGLDWLWLVIYCGWLAGCVF